MYEMLMSRTVFPDTGLGLKKPIYGSLSLGYFGEMTDAEVMTVDEILHWTQFYSGTRVFDGENGWIKVAFKGRIYLISKKPILSGVTWDALYEAGLVYGTDDTGLFQTANPTNQKTVWSKGGYQYRIKLLRGMGNRITPNDPYNSGTAANGTSGPTPDFGTEWTQIMYSLLGIAGGDPNWPRKFTLAELGFTSAFPYRTLCMENRTVSGSVGVIARGNVASAPEGWVSIPRSVSNKYTGWRPILELQKFELLPPEWGGTDVGTEAVAPAIDETYIYPSDEDLAIAPSMSFGYVSEGGTDDPPSLALIATAFEG